MEYLNDELTEMQQVKRVVQRPSTSTHVWLYFGKTTSIEGGLKLIIIKLNNVPQCTHTLSGTTLYLSLVQTGPRSAKRLLDFARATVGILPAIKASCFDDFIDLLNNITD